MLQSPRTQAADTAIAAGNNRKLLSPPPPPLPAPAAPRTPSPLLPPSVTPSFFSKVLAVVRADPKAADHRNRSGDLSRDVACGKGAPWAVLDALVQLTPCVISSFGFLLMRVVVQPCLVCVWYTGPSPLYGKARVWYGGRTFHRESCGLWLLLTFHRESCGLWLLL